MNGVASDDEDPLATIIPRPKVDVCDAVGCNKTESLVGIEPATSGGDYRTLCPEHFVDYLEEVGNP